MKLLDRLKTPAARVPRLTAGELTIKDLADPEEVTIPLESPAGLLTPEVQAGDEVARNQVIARTGEGLFMHASIGGRVREISRIWTAAGNHVPAVVIERGVVPELAPAEALARCDLDLGAATRIQLLKAGGVIVPWTRPGAADLEIRHVVVVGHDEEPTQHVQEILLQDHAARLQSSLRLLRDLAPQAAISLTVPRHLKGWAGETFGPDLPLITVGAEYRRRLVRVLVRQLTGLTVPARIPYHARGVAVITVETALAAQDALQGLPFVRKAITVSGESLARPLTVRVPVGTSVRAVLADAGLAVAAGGRVLAGGPMQGAALYTDETPVDKFQHGVHLMAAADLAPEGNLNCINCGRCVRACPAHLQVHMIGRYVQYSSPQGAADLHPEACLECGLCAYVCPSRRPLVQMVKMAQESQRKAP